MSYRCIDRNRSYEQTMSSFWIVVNTISSNSCKHICALQMSIFVLRLKSPNVMVMYGSSYILLLTNALHIGPLQTMAPPSGQTWSSMAIAAVIFENEHDVLGTLKWRKAGSKSHSHNKGVLQVPDDNSMDVDENLPLCLPPSHPLDQLHEQVVAEFTKLLGKLVLQVGGQEIHSAAESMYAPEWRQKPFSEWTPDLCLKYLNSLRKVKASSPDVGVFLTLPRSRSGISGRRGQDWSREAWDEIIKYLTRLGVIWDYSVIQETVKELEFKVERVFAMKMRPTGT